MGKMEVDTGDQSGDRQGPHRRTDTRTCEPCLLGAAQTPCASAAADPGHLPAVHAAPGAPGAVQEEPGHRAAVWGPWWPRRDPAAEAPRTAGEDCQLGKSCWGSRQGTHGARGRSEIRRQRDLDKG